ncbi:CRISPR-associated endonuclease Cas9 [Brucella endophytica]|uniref:CRISPR-associated endonuclease Cas9 n=1 Tax=Brucella endophytica TaxID=1963359 RepID=A0A916WK86_9HYPH|nr:type II CRISPR RNA-guided endonuclease Cas9 [Brucella endophytica]GGB05454.1 CRISPR-associated endonuclease Cas9 [Brucella endophytica]
MIDESLAFGIDLGIGSEGWAVLRRPIMDAPGVIEGLGSWCFDVPETDKERTPTNQIRRGNRLLRRVTRRRRKRMTEIRQVFHAHGLLSSLKPEMLKGQKPGLNPWELRARGLDKPLKPVEFAVALAHIAKRRGFKSAAKRKAANTSGDDKKMLAALEATQERLARYRTVGEMFARDPDFAARRRNRDGVFDRTASRDDLFHEVGSLFAAQRRLGQDFASPELEEAYKVIAFRQKPMQDSEKLVGACIFEPDEKRAAKLAPSFERFRLLTRLINLRVRRADGREEPLSPDELARATSDLGKTAKLTAKKVRSLIGLAGDERFTTIKPEDEGRDIATRTGEALPGTAALRKALGETLWAQMRDRPDQLDDVAHVLSFFETNDTIAAKLAELGLEAAVLDALLAALDDEKALFAKFKGAGHISAKACRALLPHLEQGKRYDEACALAGYNHAVSGLSDRDAVTTKAQFNDLVKEVGESIANPIARKALTEGLKQLWAMRNRWGLPGSIHIELARDVGNSIEKRREIESEIDKITAQRERERKEVAELLNLTHVNGDTLLRYRLWKEQGGKCLYTGKDIHITQVIATDNSVQVDHILPWSRFGDDSFNNKTLCLAGANQQKKRATPYEWLAGQGADAWEAFVERVETNKQLRGFKKRNYLLKNAEEAAKKFRERNLNDTRYAARLLAEAVKLFYPVGERAGKGERRRVYTRPGALTAALRQAWGLESLKKINGERVRDDRHHALDALTVAAIGEGEVQRLTRSFQEWEQQGLGRPLRRVTPPWDGFRNDVLAAYEKAFVARPERRRARGEGHAATIRQVAMRDGETIVFERKAVTALKEADLDRIKDPERNHLIVAAVRAWIAEGRPADKLPKSKQGHMIAKVRLAAKNKAAVMVRGGTADRGEMVRVDVFTKPNRKGKDEWYLVPIYPHQVMNRQAWPHPPMRSVVAYKDESEWTQIDAGHTFRFSLYPRSYVEVAKSTGEVFEGYFSGLDRSTGAISLDSWNDPTTAIRGIGAKTLLSIRKYTVDRFGARFEVKNEVRTWHGEECISHNPPG